MYSNVHILVVDDLPTVRWTISALLRKIGYAKVSEASDGAHALELLQSCSVIGTSVNFIVTDWNMPVMNGLALLQRIRASSDLMHLPVVMITGEAETEQFIAATQAGVDGYIFKPSLSVGILKEVLDKALIKRGVIT